MSRQTLAQQLKQLHGEEEVDDGPGIEIDETADLDGYLPGDRSGGREHYADVGPSRLRGEVSQTLLSDKYAGKVGQRMKIFDDDDEEEGEQEAEEEGIDEGSDEDAEDDDEEDEDEDDDEEEDDEDDEEEEDEEEEEEEGEEGQEDEEESEAGPSNTLRRDTQLPARALDPVAALRESRQKDIEKGRGIKRQKALFEQLITLRITFQKALSAASKLPPSIAASSSNPEITESQSDALQSLAKINEQLFDLRQLLLLPGAETPTLGKRTRDDQDEAYWVESARESLSVADQSHLHAAPILSKWAGRIQAATAAQAGGKIKFIQTSQSSIFDAINAGLATKATNDQTFEETEEVAYRALLREVIETRQGGGEGLSAFRREKKKKREAERGGSKGRKLRYTVHDKAQNFAVPVALSRGWHEEQIDELFSSLFGGAGMGGAVSKAIIPSGISDAPLNGGLADLGGLRVF